MKRLAPISLPVSPVASLGPIVGTGELASIDVGPDGIVYILVALAPIDSRAVGPGGVSFPKTVADQPQNYRVVGLLDGQIVLDVAIGREPFHIHHVQPLLDELLLVCGRSHYRGPDNFEKNGRVYSLDGRFAREILLGDGIQSVQTTSQGVIWTSYFDEGILGNFGWSNPVGASGLVAWDALGNKLYEFQPRGGLEPMADCYALNVESDKDVWCCYYMDFPLVHLHRRQIKSVWQMPLEGSDAFAVFDRYVLFRGGYDDHDLYHLFSLARQKPDLVAAFRLSDADAGELVANGVVARGDSIHLISNGFLYSVAVPAVLAASR